ALEPERDDTKTLSRRAGRRGFRVSGAGRPVSRCAYARSAGRPAEGPTMPARVRIFDTTLRDGEQSAGVCFRQADQLDIAMALDAMGVDVIEAGFPAASRADSDAVAAVAGAVRDAAVCALARAVPGDVDAAAEAVRGARRPRIHVFVNAS